MSQQQQQQAQRKTTSVILKIDIINSPQEEATASSSSKSSAEPIEGAQKPKMAKLKLAQTLLASFLVLLVVGGVAYLAITQTKPQTKQQEPNKAEHESSNAQWSSAAPESSPVGRLSAASVALSSTAAEPSTSFGRPNTTSPDLAQTFVVQEQQKTTASQQETSPETSRTFSAPVQALSTTQAARPSTNASTELGGAAEQPVASQPVQIQDTKMSILLPEPSLGDTTASSPSPPALETISVPAVSPITTEAVTSSSSVSPTAATTTSSARDPAAAPDTEQAWQEFKAIYRRQYPSQEEESRRRDIFLANTRLINAHNQQDSTDYKLGMNHFGDFTRDEINQMFIGPQISWSHTLSYLQTPIPPPIKILSDGSESQPQVDWRNITSGSPIDQGTCRESSVFAAVASIEAALNARLSATGTTWQPVKLAESQVLDCMRIVAPFDAPPICQGYSSMLHVFDLLQRSPLGGIVSLAEYMDFKSRNKDPVCDLPPVGSHPAENLNELYPQQQQQQQQQQHRVKLNSFNVIHRDNIPEALVNSGPLVVALDASQSSFHFYKSGLYYDQNCSTDTYNHHALLIGLEPIGHKLMEARDLRQNSVLPNPPSQFLVRNSLGLDWGEGGHMRILKVDDNKCLPQMAVSPNLL